jgi:hypothetical protein
MRIKIPADFTLAELRAFIEGEAREAPDGYYTSREWAEHFGINQGLRRELLNQAKERGLLRMTWVHREALDDRIHKKPVYALQARNDEISDSDQPIGPGLPPDPIGSGRDEDGG